MRRLTILVVLFLISDVAGQNAAGRPSLVRIVVLDTSSSMAGERIDQAKKDLHDVGRHLPPSAAHPIIIVPFSDRVGDVRTFTDQTSYESYLGKVNAGGGTSIAAGLERALAELKSYQDAKHICVLLYSDGEDGDQAGIHKQEEQLDRLFADRGKRGLKQSVVFCKRWQQANADLLNRISKRGNAQVIDAGELRIQHVTFTPTLTVGQVRWAKDQFRLLEIDVLAKVEAKGHTSDPLPIVKMFCRTPKVQGDTAVLLRPGEPKYTLLRLRLPATAPMLAARKTELNFSFEIGPAISQTKSLLFPLLPTDQLRLAVIPPREPFRHSLKVALAASKPAYWSDPLSERLAFPMALTVEVASQPDQPWPEAIPFQIKLPAGHRLAAGQDTFTLNAPGKTTFAITVEPAPYTAPTKAGSPRKLTIAVSPKQVSTETTVEPSEAVAHADVLPPPPASTHLSLRVLNVGPSQWVDVVRGVAAFEADVEVRVQGPLARDTAITVQCPPAVRNIHFNPSKITTGTQTVRFTVEAELAPAPARKTLIFRIQPPVQQGAVRIAAPPPLRLSVIGPAPVQLALRYGSTIPSVLTTVTFDKDQRATLTVTPILVGLPDSARADGMAAKIACGSRVELSNSLTLGMNQPVDISPLSGPGTQTSFFLDTVIEEELTILPASPSPAVLGSKQKLRLTVEAPFKRLAFYLTGALAAVAALYFVLRMVLRLSNTEQA